MELSIYFLKDNKLMIGKLDISLTEKSEQIFNNCLEIVSDLGGILIYVKSTKKESYWWNLKLFELDSLCYLHFSKNKQYSDFLQIKEYTDFQYAKGMIFEIIEESQNHFTQFLKSNKIKRVNEK